MKYKNVIAKFSRRRPVVSAVEPNGDVYFPMRSIVLIFEF